MDDFTTASQAAVAAFYEDLTDPNGRALLGFLIDHAGERHEAREIMSQRG